MPKYGPQRTAVLVDVTTFGGPYDPASELPLRRFEPLPFGAAVDELSISFERVGYQVIRLTNPTANQLDTEIRRVVADHGSDDVVAVHIMSHGYAGKIVQSFHICGSDATPDGPSVELVHLLQDFLLRENGPHILLSLDLCHAGMGVELEHDMRIGKPKKLWLITAAAGDQAAYNARFTTAVTNTLNAVRAGLQGVATDLPYVPFNDFARTVGVKLNEALQKEQRGIPQDVTATIINGAQDVRNLPFFANEWYRRGLTVPSFGEQLVRANVPDELTYFAIAANVQRTDDADHTDFTGRAAEMSTLFDWLRGSEETGPRLVTGRAGSGKSALLGALVCAAHPILAPHIKSITKRIGVVPQAEMMAAVPARHRDVAGFVAVISAQLLGAKNIHTPEGLVATLRARRARDEKGPRAVIVVDSLDEAAAPEQVYTELLKPLSDARDVVGEVMIASRSTSDVTALIRGTATAVIDLDRIDPGVLRKDIEAYVWKLLSDAHDYVDRPDIRGALAWAVARRLVAGSRSAWGEFLVTRLYVHHLLQNREPETDVDKAKALGNEVPLDLAAVLELGLATRTGETWTRPILAALALVHGLGAPANVLADLAGVCAGLPHVRPEPEKLAEVLDSLGAYLRVIPAPDGEERYQLFHEGLAEHLRDHPVSSAEENPVSAKDVCGALLGGVRSWTTADRYVLRHALHHARGTALLEQLLEDPDFLLCGRSEALLAVAEIAEDRGLGSDLQLLAYAAQAVIAENMRTPGDRERLAVVAVRAGSVRLARALSAGAYRPVLVLDLPTPPATSTVPVLLSGSDFTSQVQVYNPNSDYCKVFQVRHPNPVVSLCAWTRYDGELITGDIKGVARVWPLFEGSVPRLTRPGHIGAVRALTILERDGEPPVFMSADDQTLRLWNSEDGDWVKTIHSSAYQVTGLAPFSSAGRGHARVLVQSATTNYVLNLSTHIWEELPDSAGLTVLCPAADRLSMLTFGKRGVVSSVDLSTFERERWLSSADGLVTAAAHIPGMREPAVVSGDSSGRLTLWELGTRTCSELGSVNGQVTALTAFVVNGRPTVVCASADGMVSVWDPEKCVRRNSFTVGQHVRAFAHDWSPTLEAHRTAPLMRCGWGFGGVVIAMVDEDNTVRVHRSTGPELMLGPFERAIANVSVESKEDWALVVVEDDRGLVQVWHPVTKDLLDESGANNALTSQSLDHILLVHNRLVRPEGGQDGHVQLIPLAGTEHVVIDFVAHSGPVTALAAWRHGGSARIATSGADGFLRVWDVESHELQYEMTLRQPARNIVAVHGDHLVVQTDAEVIVLSQKEPS